MTPPLPPTDKHTEGDLIAMMVTIKKYWEVYGEPELRDFAEYVLNLMDTKTHQAVQAFGEKVLEEIEKLPFDCKNCGHRTTLLEAKSRKFLTGMCAQCGADLLFTYMDDVSVITSLMNGDVK